MSRKTWTLVAFAIGLYACLLLGVAIVLRIQGDREWWSALLCFGPRWVWAVPLLALVPMAWRTDRRLIAGVGFCACLVVWPINGLRISPLAWMTWSGQDLRIISCNVDGMASSPAKFSALLEQASPDIVLLQEASEPWLAQVRWPAGWQLHAFKGLEVASRYPIRASATLGDDVLVAYGCVLRCDIETPRGIVHVFNVHLESPKWGLDPFLHREVDGLDQLRVCLLRRQNAAEFASLWVRGVEGPVIVGGDFNMPDDSPTFRECWHDFADAFSEVGTGFGNTKWTGAWGARIDHVLYGPEFSAIRCAIGPDIRSDHRPLIAGLRWRG